MLKNIIYITRDRERADSLAEDNKYKIISSKDGEDTYEILSRKETIDQIKNTGSSIVVFKSSSKIEEIAKENGIEILNPKSSISEEIENKVSQVKWLGELENLLPEHKIIRAKEINWEGKIFVLQWAHGHTGESTYIINNEKDLDKIKKNFPERDARVTEYINGPVFTVNVVVAKNIIAVGNISYQITGILPFTDNMMSTIGNDWSLPQTLLTDKNLQTITNIAKEIGEKMRSVSWKGLFGIDIIYDESRDKIFLLEINARQPASTTLESKLQLENRSKGIKGLTTFEAHIKALLGEDIEELIEINDGAQIVKRITEKEYSLDTKTIENNGFSIIRYNNNKHNSDLFRIQSSMGIMEAHNKFNKRGKIILESIV